MNVQFASQAANTKNMNRAKFQKLVEQAIQQLPAEFREKLENACYANIFA